MGTTVTLFHHEYLLKTGDVASDISDGSYTVVIFLQTCNQVENI